MIDESIRLKRKLIELEGSVQNLNMLFELNAVKKKAEEIERLGKIIDYEADTLNTINLRNALINLKAFISQVEASDEYRQEEEKDNE